MYLCKRNFKLKEMRYKSIDNSKLDMSVFRLEELVAAYGGYDILEYNDDDPQGSPETAVVAVDRWLR